MSVPPSGSAGTSGAALAAFYRQRLSWHDCGGGFQCSSLLVPIDYRQPAGATMHIAVIRKRASGRHEGSLIINPGGPGGSGLDYARCCASQFDGVTTHFDLVSFDPRGVGQSRPIRCMSFEQLDAYLAVDPVPDAPGEHEAVVNSSRQFAEDCARRNGSYLEHVGTIDAARDMDVLRAALGDAKLTYYGASYGTYLGAKYAQLFPTRIRAMVLDGAVDPSETSEDANRVQATGFETDLRDFLASCVASGSCPFGSTQQAAESGLNRLIQRVDDHPEQAGSRQLGAGEFFLGLASGLYSPSEWPDLRVALGAAQNGQGRDMLLFADALTGRNPDGTFNNLVESNTAINCIDRPSPRNVATYDADARTFAGVAPHFGVAIAYGSLPCAFWPVPPVEQTHPVRAPGAPPIVVIGTTRDPATPYVWAQALARQLSSGVLVTFNGDGHTAYDRANPCILGVVNDYLDRLVVPKPGVRCG